MNEIVTIIISKASDLLGIVGILCLFGGTAALSAGWFSNFIAKEYIYNQNPKRFYKLLGHLFNIKNKYEANRQFMGGSWEEIKKNHDTNAPIRGIVWYVVGTLLVIFSILIKYL